MMNSIEFRKKLRQEAEKWRSQELINTDQYQQLADMYSFESIEANTEGKFATILIGLGCILMALGLITLVAANWQVIPKVWRLVLLLIALISANVTGFYMWRGSDRWRRLGQGLLIFAALLLGANIALVGQMFHVDGELYNLYFMWAIGVTTMAYGLRFMPLGVLALILFALGYYEHLGQYRFAVSATGFEFGNLIASQMLLVVSIVFVPLAYWCRSRAIAIITMLLTGQIYLHYLDSYSSRAADLGLSWLNLPLWLTIEYMPILAVLVFVPLAYRCRSRLVFVVAVLLVVAGLFRSAGVIVAEFDNSNLITSLAMAITTSIPPLLLWGYRDRWLDHSILARTYNGEVGIAPKRFAPLARGVAIACLSVTTYAYSFYRFWNWQPENIRAELFAFAGFSQWASVLSLGLFAGLAIWGWFGSRFTQTQSPPANTANNELELGDRLLTNVIAGISIAMGLTFFWHGAVAEMPEVMTFIYNVLLFLLAAGMIRISLEKSRRLPFWTGTILLILQITSRMFEYNTGLAFKAAIFMLCGVAVISAGIWFERYLTSSSPASALETSGNTN
ncbi:Protein of unknown function DUF2157, membrane [Thalassoporum mexicanum PCC 7367]|uniref:DUF2157 domain-containing protein n=2 Tax=Thalassoporum mexicanum TaxID=3457544 RepID=UPI00029F9FD1|nr:DUF2157 domain-containing protein [Pseudanabaena sp. PCC 7367]AFY69986.1 Protein of unknown function DUF2157, membrane [Pseudanabaena sp. PCC 7367]